MKALAAVLLALLWCGQQGKWDEGWPCSERDAQSRLQTLRVTQPRGKTWLREEVGEHLQAEARGRWVGCAGSPRVPKPPAPAPARHRGVGDPPHPTPPSFSLSGFGVAAIRGPEWGAVKGQRPIPSVIGKDATRLHASQEVGRGSETQATTSPAWEGQGGQRDWEGGAGPRGGGTALGPKPVSSVPG